MYQYAPDLLEGIVYALQLEAGDCGEIGFKSHPGAVYYASDRVFYYRRINSDAFSTTLAVDAQDTTDLLAWLQGEKWIDVLVGYDSLVFLGNGSAHIVSTHPPRYHTGPLAVKRMFVGYVEPDAMHRIWEMVRGENDIVILATTDQDVVASVRDGSGSVTDWHRVGYTPYRLDWCFEIPPVPFPPHAQRWWQADVLYTTGWPRLELVGDGFGLTVCQAIVADHPWRRWRIAGASRLGVYVQTGAPELLGSVSQFSGDCYRVPLQNILGDLSHLEAMMESTMIQHIVPHARQKGYEIPAFVALGWDGDAVVLKHPRSVPEVESEIVGALDAWIRYLAERWVAERLGHPCFA
jgi:hypothetical protein